MDKALKNDVFLFEMDIDEPLLEMGLDLNAPIDRLLSTFEGPNDEVQMNWNYNENDDGAEDPFALFTEPDHPFQFLETNQGLGNDEQTEAFTFDQSAYPNIGQQDDAPAFGRLLTNILDGKEQNQPAPNGTSNVTVVQQDDALLYNDAAQENNGQPDDTLNHPGATDTVVAAQDDDLYSEGTAPTTDLPQQTAIPQDPTNDISNQPGNAQASPPKTNKVPIQAFDNSTSNMPLLNGFNNRPASELPPSPPPPPATEQQNNNNNGDAAHHEQQQQQQQQYQEPPPLPTTPIPKATIASHLRRCRIDRLTLILEESANNMRWDHDRDILQHDPEQASIRRTFAAMATRYIDAGYCPPMFMSLAAEAQSRGLPPPPIRLPVELEREVWGVVRVQIERLPRRAVGAEEAVGW